MSRSTIQKASKPPTAFNNVQAYSEGWGLFTLDGGTLAIQRLDDPPNARPLKCECDNTHEAAGTCCRACWRAGYRHVAPSGPVFDCDSEALDRVMGKASEGSRYHRKAIALAAGISYGKRRKQKPQPHNFTGCDLRNGNRRK